MPVLVGGLLHQLVDSLMRVGTALIPELAAVGAQPAAQGALGVGQMLGRVRVGDAEVQQRGAGGLFRRVAGVDDGLFQLPAQGFGEGVHEESSLVMDRAGLARARVGLRAGAPAQCQEMPCVDRCRP
ncbi:hypothetical protein [Thiohalocapsa halophila]|uniref:hypothetical protein n=1 Tax=Thiohalocapsa halophila TaxID=69359 RepID=UPI001F5BD468|nr:hypothetical protein [Thiohalocapsa halophila]